MKTEADRLAVKDAAALVARTAGRRSTLPALSGVLVEAHQDGRLTLSTTDLERAIVAEIPADVVETGRVLVPAKALQDIVKTGADRLTFSADDGAALDITGDGATVRMRTMPVEDWPALPTLPDDAPGVTLTARDLDVIGRVRTSASSEEARPVLTGVHFDADTGEAVATDSYTMHVGQLTDADGVAAALGGTLVPARTLSEVGRWKLDGRTVRARSDVQRVACPSCHGKGWRGTVAPDGAASSSASTGCGRCASRGTVAQVGSVELVGVHVAGPKTARRETVVRLWSRTIEGTFPNWRGLWPDETGEILAPETDELGAAIDQVRSLGARANTPVVLTVDGGRLQLTVKAPELGEVVAAAGIVGTVPADWPSIAFAPDLLSRSVKAAGAGVSLHARDGLKPMILAGSDRVRVLQMPMRIS